ncbi:hypothetical protein [Halomonas sp. hl-4]|uniref:hypothetical protein n=1 Tax=Halomonas sp. hl-4 TaxID=1761789 RepID=UPI000BB689B2|nr:hypothetical protein [Halomonas sp. hl-4]SNY95519.1 hypothetical protein SAMN04488142_0019 [Halomonas sp. hl-4]
MNPNIPNALWAKHGYTIERQQRRTGGPKVRTIRNPAGKPVLHDASYDAEMAWIKRHLEPDLPIVGPDPKRYIITGDTPC